MSKWKECTLGEIAEVQTGPFGSQLKNKQYIQGDTPVVTVEHIDNFRIIDFDYPSIAQHDKERLSKYLLKSGDIVFTRVDSVDLSAYVRPHQDGWMFSSRMLRVRPNNSVDSRYLSHYFQQESFREHILSISVGATMPSINTEILEGVSVSYPPIEEQRAISSILSSLDDKIDLLHRQNKTLEAMAETLFRQWFMEAAEYDSESQILLSSLIESISITHTFPSPRIIFLNTSDVYLGDVINHSYENVKNLPGQAKKTIMKDDILFSEIRPANGRYAYIDFEADDYVVSTKLMVLRSKYVVSQAFVYFYLINKRTIELLQTLAEARSGTFPQITFDQLCDLVINVPSNEVLNTASQLCNDWLKKIKTNQNQIRMLKLIRNILLSKLLTGEIEVEV